MVYWCISSLIYLIIWNFVFEFYIKYIYFLWSLWRCMQTERLQWSVSLYRMKVLASLPFLKPILTVLHKIMLVFSVSGLVQFLPQQNLVVITTHCQSFTHSHHIWKSRKVRPKQIKWCRSSTARNKSLYSLVVKVWHNLASFLFPFSHFKSLCGTHLEIYTCVHTVPEIFDLFLSFYRGPHSALLCSSLLFSIIHS